MELTQCIIFVLVILYIATVADALPSWYNFYRPAYNRFRRFYRYGGDDDDDDWFGDD